MPILFQKGVSNPNPPQYCTAQDSSGLESCDKWPLLSWPRLSPSQPSPALLPRTLPQVSPGLPQVSQEVLQQTYCNCLLLQSPAGLCLHPHGQSLMTTKTLNDYPVRHYTRYFIYLTFFNPYSRFIFKQILLSILQIRKQRHRLHSFAQSHTVSRWQATELALDNLVLNQANLMSLLEVNIPKTQFF